MEHRGDVIKALRKKARLTQTVLAERAGIAIATVGRIERNQVEAQQPTLEAIAGALGLPLSQLQALYEQAVTETAATAQEKRLMARMTEDERRIWTGVLDHEERSRLFDMLRTWVEDGPSKRLA